MPHTTVTSRKQYRLSQVAVAICAAAVLILTMIWPQGIVNADTPKLSVEIITWNVIGLDSNDPALGPQNFPVGVRVCNTTDAAIDNVGAVWNWDGDNSGGNIALRSNSLSEYSGTNLVSSLAAHACHDFYFEVHVNPVQAAFDTWRNFHVTATIGGAVDGSSPVRQLYVEHLISQSRNSTSSVTVDGQVVPVGGTVNLIIGNTYEIILTGSTATNGYNQLESFINFPSTVFRILSVSTHYQTENSPYISNDHPSLYGDACGWDSNQNSPTYNSCIGSDGKVGNTITVTYLLQIIGGGGTTQELSNLIYDFSGSSFHYNADYSFGGRVAAIINPTLLTITKAFTPSTTIPNAATALTFTINNTNAATLTGVSFTDNLPTTPGAMIVANPPNASTTNCGTATFAPTAGSASLSFSNGTIPANGSCTVSVNVVAPVVGTYSNTSEYLHIGSFVTSSRATASLVVGTAPAAPTCTANLVLAQWSMAATTNPPTNPDIRAGNVVSASASAGAGLTASITTGASTYAWQAYGFSTSTTLDMAQNDYYQFAVDTSQYSNISITFDHQRRSPGPRNLRVAYSTDPTGTFTLTGAVINTGTSWGRSTISLAGLTSTTGITYIRIFGYNANNSNTGSELLLDNITFTTSCGVPGGPTITKTFTPSTVAVNGTSALLFTIANSYYTYNTGTGVLTPLTLSGITFTDSLPSGLSVAATPGMSTTCSGSPSWTTSAGTLTFGNPTSASLAGGSSCTATVNITATTTGPHNNISSYIYSTQSGNNIGPGGIASASLNAIQAPIISKSFSPDPILLGQTSVLTITITNPNPSDALSSVAFTDDLPVGLTDSSSPTSTCGPTPTISTVGSQRRITLSGGSLAAGASCTVTLTVTPASATDYNNVTGLVSAASVGNGNTASDTLHVQPVHPRLSIIKQVSTSATGPWSSYVGVAANTPVYYRFVVENTGDVDLTSVHVNDPTLTGYEADLGDCDWSSMAVMDLQECIVGPVPYHSGWQTNTATALGTHIAIDDVSSLPDNASYATEGITLVKSVQEAYYAAENDELHYRFLVTNSGTGALLGPVTINDPMFTSVTCPEVNTVGDLDEFLDGGEEITCTATYTVSADDVSAGSIENTATASVDGVDSNPSTATIYVNLPDLQVTKENNTFDVAQINVPFTWTLTVSNPTGVSAVFEDGDLILQDPLPVGATYSVLTNPANTSCAIDGSRVLVCSADGAQITVTNSANLVFTLQVNPTVGGTLDNTVTVDPSTLIPEAVEDNNTASDSVFVEDPSLTLVKNITSGNPYTAFGDTIQYEYIVTNDGNVPLDGPVTVDDDQATVTCPAVVTLAPAASVTCTASHSVSVLDMSTGSITNTAVAHADGIDSDPAQATATLSVTRTLSLVKNITAGDPYTLVGSSVDYEFIVTNTGNVALTGPVTVDDDQASVSCPSITFLDPGDSVTCTASHTVTLADLNAGSLTNSAIAHADGVDSNTANATATADQNPSLNLVKNITSGDPYSIAGAAVNYEYIVTNNGNITLDGPVTVDDNQATVTCPVVTTLDPGNSVTCTASHTVTQANLDAGSITNTATAHTDGVDSNTATAIADADQNPSLNLTKSITSGDLYSTAGDTIEYEYLVENNGNVTLDGPVTVDDDQETVTCPAVAQLAPGASTICSSTHVVTLADLNAGSLTNTATAHADGNNSNTDTATATAEQNPSLDLVKNITSGDPYSTTGSTVSYEYIVTNNGNITINGAVSVDDNQAAVTCPVVTTLDPGDSVTCTASHTISQADIDAGSLTNTATAHAGGVDSNTTTATATADLNPSLNLVKNITSGNPYNAEGDIVEYEYIVTNDGNVTLHGAVSVDDDQATVTCPSVAQLAPGESVTCTASHTIVQADIDNGSLTNFATAHEDGVDSNTASAEAFADQNPSISLTKNIVGGNPYSTVGSTIGYEYTITNTGNVSLYATPTVDDDQTTVSCPTDVLLIPGTSVVCTANHTITQADIDAGSITNTATAHMDGQDSNTTTATAYAVQNPDLTLVKTITAGDPYSVEGASISYEYQVINSGNVTLLGAVTVDDDQVSVSCPAVTELAPGGSVTCTASYTVALADLNAGSVTNTATAHADGLDSNTTSATAYADQNPSLQLIKNITGGDPYSVEGATVGYEYLVTNNGNITLDGPVSVDDNQATVTCPAVTSLEPGDSVTCTASHTVTQADLDAGSLTNTATAHADGIDSNTATATAFANQHAELTLVKNITAGDLYAVSGASIDYEYVVTNTGNVTLDGPVTVDDDQATVSCPSVAEMLPGGSVTCTASHTVNQADLDAGSLTNTATAHADGVDSNTATATATADQTPSLDLVKTITSGDPYSVDGSTIDYQYVVTNNGNITLNGAVTIDDDLVSVTCPSVTSLSPSTSVTCTAFYTVILADLNVGSITNTATAHQDGVASNTTFATATADQNPSLSLVKNITAGDPYSVQGATVDYEYIVTNDGNITLYGAITVDDNQATVTCPSVTQLDPGDSVTCTASHSVTLADLNAGSLTNTATAHEDGVDSNTATATATADQNPSLTLTKNITAGDPYSVDGGTIDYEYIVTNDGNISLDGPVTVDDDQATVTCPFVSVLDPGDSVTCTAAHTVTLSDLNAGSLTNTATAHADGVDSNTAFATATATQNPSLTLVKNITSGDSYSVDGAAVNYEYIVTNDGNITLHGAVTVDDDQAAVTCPSVTQLDPGDSVTCTATHTVTLADLNTGSITNIASAHQDGIASNTATATATAAQNPSLDLVKNITGGDPYSTVGGTVEYEYIVTNDGNVTLYGAVTVDDDQATVTCPAVTQLDPSDSVTCTASHTVSQADIDAGILTNNAAAHEDGVDSNTASASAAADQNPSLALTKNITSGDPYSVDGGSIGYEYIVTNDGNVTLHGDVTVDDDQATVTCPTVTALGPGDSTTCTASHTVTLADLNAGSLTNTATAHQDGVDSDTATATATANQNPSLALVKSITSGDPYALEGDTINYDYLVSNDGNITLHGAVSVDDDLTTVTCPTVTQLDPGDSVTCTASYSVTLGDVSNGSVENTATAHEDGFDSNPSSATAVANQDPELTLVKSIATSASGPWSTSITVGLGDDVYYQFEITNSGNVPLTDLSITDANVSSSSCVFSATLDPVDSTTCVVGPISAGAGTNINTATAHGDFDGTTYNSVPDSATYFGQNPSVSIVKQVSTNGSSDWNDDSVTVTIGDTVYYQIIIANTGNIPLTTVNAGDDQCTLSSPSGDLNGDDTLDLSEQWVYTCSTTSATGVHTNTASVTTYETSTSVTDTASYFGQDPSIGIAKDVTSVTFISTGTYQVEYSLRIHNYSNVTLNNIEVTDDLSDTFPTGTNFEVISVTSPTLSINEAYDGSSDIQLLTGFDSLDSNEDGTITLVVQVIPASQGPFNNSAFVSGFTSLEVQVTDQSQDGLNPDLDGDGDPTNDSDPTPVTIVPTIGNLYDPPTGIKTYDANNIPVLNWTMVWINNSNLVGINASVHDPITDGTTFITSGAPSGYPLPATYPDGSTTVGVSCTDTSGITYTTRCYYEGPTPEHLNGQIVWEGFIGPDYGVTDPDVSVNDIHISFNVTVADDIFSVQNEATVDSDLNGNLLATDSGEQQVASAADEWTAVLAVDETTALPATGFAPNIQTVLPEQPADMAYTDLDGLWLEIPDLGVESSIVGIPATLSGWNISWLGSNAGWLNGTAYPTWTGNSVITGHVYLPNGQPGPFVNLGNLAWGDRIIIHLDGQSYIYEVRQVTQVSPTDTSVMGHRDQPWITLITCRGYNEATNTYAYRVAVQAVLIRVVNDYNPN